MWHKHFLTYKISKKLDLSKLEFVGHWILSSVSWNENKTLVSVSLFFDACYRVNCLSPPTPKVSYIEALESITSECDCIWKQGLQTGEWAEMGFCKARPWFSLTSILVRIRHLHTKTASMDVCAHRYNHVKRGAKAMEMSFRGIQQLQQLHYGFLKSPQLWNNEFLLFYPFSLWCSVISVLAN